MTPISKRFLLAVLVASFAVQTALVYTDDRSDPLSEPARRGRALWHENACQVCHQIYGNGGFLGPDLTNAFSRVDSVRLASLLTVGGGQMPAFAFSSAEIADIRAYLEALDRPDVGRGQLRLGSVTAGGPWDRLRTAATDILAEGAGEGAVRGWEAFAARSCAACHVPLAASALGAPDLSRVADRLDGQALRALLSDGRPDRGMPPPSPAFTESELGDVIAWLIWLRDRRGALTEAYASASSSRTVDWGAIPWWEYR